MYCINDYPEASFFFFFIVPLCVIRSSMNNCLATSIELLAAAAVAKQCSSYSSCPSSISISSCIMHVAFSLPSACIQRLY